MISMIANRRMVYRTRRLQAGDTFEARDLAARFLVRRNKARVAEQPLAEFMAGSQWTPEQLARFDIAKDSQPSIAGDDIEILRATARALSIDIDGRWGVKRLQTEIEKARG